MSFLNIDNELPLPGNGATHESDMVELVPSDGVISARRKTQVLLDELIAVNFVVVDDVTPFQVWPEYRKFFMPIDTCARHLLIGSKKSLEAAPEEFKKFLSQDESGQPKYDQGEDAYRHLLRIASGLESPNKGEHEVTNQFKERYQEFESIQNDRDWSIHVLYQKVLQDVKLVRANILTQLKPAGIGYSAFKLSEADNKASVLVIGHTPDDTTDLLRAFSRSSHHGKNSVKEIFFTHPDPILLKAFEQRIAHDRREKKINCEISSADFKAAIEIALPLCSHIVCCYPLNDSSEGWSESLTMLSDQIIHNWHWDLEPTEESVDPGKFIEIGKPLEGDEAREELVRTWMEQTRGRFIRREAIIDNFREAKNHRAAILTMAENACINIAYTRATDFTARIDGNLIQFDHTEYKERLAKIE